VNVGGAHRVPIEQVEDDTSRAISGKRVCCRSQAVEVVFTILVCPEFSAEVVVALVVRVLEVVWNMSAVHLTGTHVLSFLVL
jgi:hypothetical protein